MDEESDQTEAAGPGIVSVLKFWMIITWVVPCIVLSGYGAVYAAFLEECSMECVVVDFAFLLYPMAYLLYGGFAVPFIGAAIDRNLALVDRFGRWKVAAPAWAVIGGSILIVIIISSM